jgi:hypothetical protein
MASRVPDWSKLRLSIDFGGQGKIVPGRNSPPAREDRQNFPLAAIVAGRAGQIIPLLGKLRGKKLSKTARNHASRWHRNL